MCPALSHPKSEALYRLVNVILLVGDLHCPWTFTNSRGADAQLLFPIGADTSQYAASA